MAMTFQKRKVGEQRDKSKTALQGLARAEGAEKSDRDTSGEEGGPHGARALSTTEILT